MMRHLIVPALLGALALGATPALAAVGYARTGSSPHIGDHPALASASPPIVSFVDSGRAIARDASSDPVLHMRPGVTPPAAGPVTAIQDYGRTTRSEADVRALRTAEAGADARCRAFESMFDKADTQPRADSTTRTARMLRTQGGALCAAGKDSQGIARLELALHDLLGVTPAL